MRLEYYEILNSRFALEHRYKADDAMKIMPPKTYIHDRWAFPDVNKASSESAPPPDPPRRRSAPTPKKNRSSSRSEVGNKNSSWLYRCASRLDVDYKNRVVKKTQHGWNDGLILLGKPVTSERDGIARWSVRLDRTRKATIGLCRTWCSSENFSHITYFTHTLCCTKSTQTQQLTCITVSNSLLICKRTTRIRILNSRFALEYRYHDE